MSAAQAGIMAVTQEWQGPHDDTFDALQWRYQERWLLSTGELFAHELRRSPYRHDPRVYRNISLLWNHTARIVDFYSSMIYQGALSAELGQGAMPVVPGDDLTRGEPARTDDDGTETRAETFGQADTLMTAIAALDRRWNWQVEMTVRPRLTTALGDLLTELVHDSRYRHVYPQTVWPGHVREVERDYVGNVRAYTIEYQVQERDDRGNATETYVYRKEVDGENFRYFKNDQPFDYHGSGSVVPNRYGFAPAIWDQHRPGLGDRGYAATDATRQALFSLNSLFSHSRDFQHKAFAAPIIIRGRITSPNQATVTMPAAPDRSAMAEQHNYLEAPEGDAGIDQPVFDIGQTIAQLELLRDGILDHHPEATFFDKLAEQSSVTGPGADRIILPVKGIVEQARNRYDWNTVHLHQMAISMCADHLHAGDWDRVVGVDGIDRPRPVGRDREAFRPYTVDSYHEGLLEFSIGQRDIVPPSRSERITQAQEIERLMTLWGLEYAGLDGDDARRLLAERAALIGEPVAEF